MKTIDNPVSVLIMDDDPVSVFLTEEILKDHFGMLNIHSFTDPFLCLDFLTGSKDSSLVLLDINMPKLNGWDFIQKFQELNLRHKIIFLTSSINEDDRKKALALGVGFMTKPLDPESIKTSMNTNSHVNG